MRYVSLLAMLLIVALQKHAVAAGDFQADYVLVTVSSVERVSLLIASRLWRKRIRAFALVNCAALASAQNIEGLEEIGSYPDAGFVPSNPGVHRLALAPAIAAMHLAKSNSSYKWMLYGDDDTVFVLENVAKLLEGYDSALPLLLSDSYWWVPAAADGASVHVQIVKPIHPRAAQERPGRQRWPDSD
jgi:hypothetical protein